MLLSRIFSRPLSRLMVMGLAISLLPGCFRNQYEIYSKKDRAYIQKTYKPDSRHLGKAAAYGIGAAGSVYLGGGAAYMGVAISILSGSIAGPLIFLTAPLFFIAGGYCLKNSLKNARGEYVTTNIRSSKVKTSHENKI